MAPQACAWVTWIFMKIVLFSSAIATAALLTGCYVVPIQPVQQQAPAGAIAVMPPVPLTFTARLYPSNEAATGYGMVTAVVTNDMNGRGHFSANIGGENFNGESTRAANSRDGVANGAGQRGRFINCRYSMNSPVMGTGSCSMSDGATFSMHVGG